MTFRLERDGFTTLTLTPANGWTVRGFDMGFPTVRVVSDARPQADGEDDRTGYFGSRLVSLNLLASKSRQAAVDDLAPFVVPEARAYLYYQSSPGVERRILLRGREVLAPWTGPPGKLEALVQWEAPNGTTETANEATVTADAVIPPAPGFTFDLTFDIVFPSSSPGGSVTVTTAGAVNSYPVVRLYGPCVTPRIENITTGQTLDFDIDLPDGQYLEVDTRNKTVLLNGSVTQNRYSTMDFTTSEWWVLRPGENLVRYYPVTYSGASRAVLTWRGQFI